MFVTDTVDAVYRPDDWSPEAMFDQLADIVGSLPIPDTVRARTLGRCFPYLPRCWLGVGAHAIQERPCRVSIGLCLRQLPIEHGGTVDAAAHVERVAPDRLCSRSEIVFLSREYLDVRERVCERRKHRLGGCGARVVGGHV